jgi:hypothetical protein
MILSALPWTLVTPLKRLEVLRQDCCHRYFRCKFLLIVIFSIAVAVAAATVAVAVIIAAITVLAITIAAVGKRTTNKPLAPSPSLVLQHLYAEIGVNSLCRDKKAPTTVMLVLQ